MDLRHYEHIIALAENGNFRKAAEAVHISTPALTKSIQKSEEFFDVKLFDRTRTGVTPTPFGEIIVRKARVLLKDAGEISSDVQSLMKMESGRVRVACGMYAAESLMGNALARFIPGYPGVRVEVTISNFEEMIQMLTDREIDFFVSVYPQHLKFSKSVEVVDLETEDLVWFCRPRHPLLNKKKITISEIASFPLFFPSLTKPINEWIIKVFKGTPIVKLDGTIEADLQCNEFGILKKAVAGSNGIGVFYRSSLSHDLEDGNLHELPFKTAIPATIVGIVFLRDRMLPLAAERLILILKEEHFKLLKKGVS
jgi:DNA-binding transcriptional LysR family regulator